jgi:signal transduction histidine kinase
MSRRSAWVAWSVAVLAIALGAIGIWIGFVNAQPVGFEVGALLVAVVPFTLIGALIASRFPQNPIGWIFCAVGALQGLESASYQYALRAVILEPGTLPLGGFAAWVAFWAWMPSLGLLTTFLFLLFPNGRPASSRWRWVGWTAGIGLGLIVLGAGVGGALAPPRVLMSETPVGFSRVAELTVMVGFFVVLVASVAAVCSLVVRFRRSTGDERQQLKWMAFAASFALIAILVQFLPAVLPEAFGLLMAVGLLAVPVASGVAILKYRLYDIDLVINKTLVYGALAVFVTLVYIGIVVGIGALVGSRGNLFLSILATAVIALAFHPVRQWAGRLANRVVYGKRATPYEVLSHFSQRMGGRYSADEVLPEMARTLGEGAGASRTEVWLRVGGELRREASWPSPEDEGPVALPLSTGALPTIPGVSTAFPVEHRGELLGALAISMPRGETVTPATEKLVGDVASQAGLVLRNVRLIEELRASRQRLVAAQDQERRRLERNIHDGAQQQLVALSVKLRLAENLARKDPDKAAEMMAQVRAETQQALDDLRDLARGIYPPLLADKGLAAALESQARKAVLPVTVEPDGVGRYPQEAEAAAYFCVLEALQNVSKYAQASTAVVRLSEENGDLVFAVTDDGRGFDTETTPRGSGLQNMADRLDALGGRFEIVSRPNQGTTVKGRIPIQRVASAQASSSRSGSNSDLGM